MSRHRRRSLLRAHQTVSFPAAEALATESAPSSDQANQWSTFFQRCIILLFHLVLLIVPFVFTWVNEELFEFNKMVVTYGLASLIGVAWLMRIVVEQRLIFRRTLFDLPFALFLISQVASTLFSIHPYTSIFGYYTRFHGGLLSTLTYLLLYYAFVSNVPKSQIPRLFLTLSLAAIGVSLYAIPEHFGHSPSCWLISNGENFDVSCWVQDVKSRIFGTFGQPNWLAAYAVTLIPLFMAVPTKTGRQIAWYWLASVLLVATLIFTQSRSGQLGLAIGLILFGVLWGGWNWLKRPSTTRSQFGRLGLWASGIVALVLVFGTVATPSIFTWLRSDRSSSAEVTQPTNTPSPTPQTVNRLEEGGTSSGEIRKIVWTGALAVARRYPLFGSGVETFAYSYYQDRPLNHNLVSEWDFLYNKAHNEFLNFLATTGVIGLVTYCLIFAWVGWHSLRFLKTTQDPDASLLTIGIVSGIAALSVSNFFGFSTVVVTILLFWYLALLEIVIRSTPQPHPAVMVHPQTSTLSSSQYVGLGVSALIALYLLWSVITMWTADYAYAQGKRLLASGYTNEGLEHLIGAAQQSPHEALYYDELATTYSALAVQLARLGEATTAAQLAQTSVETSDKTLELNPRHLNFHKSRARIYITLAELDVTYLNLAIDSLRRALELAPTDAKLMYNLALVQLALNQTSEGITSLETTIAMKPNYEAARVELAQQYINQGKLLDAKAQYEYILTNVTPGNQPVQEKLTALEASISGQPNQ